jgi:surface antigen
VTKWLIILALTLLTIAGYFYKNQYFDYGKYPIGTAIDSFNHVKVYYNGKVSHTDGRNLSSDGYNLGLKYQCVEFVKRYYYEFYHHKMPDSYGNAKDFFDSKISDGSLNKKRDLIQMHNPSKNKPQVGDLLVFSETQFNPYGHVAIISEVNANQIEIIQQNPGPYAPSRINIDFQVTDSGYKICESRILGWLRMKKNPSE